MISADLEDIIDAVKALFESQFSDTLAQVDSEKSVPLSPKAPQKWYFGDVVTVPVTPSMLFSGHETTTEEDEGDWRRQRYTLEIEAYISNGNVETLSRIVRRYGSAIDRLLMQNQTINGSVSEVLKIRQKYWDSMSAKTGLLQAVNVTFDVIVMTN